MADDDPSFHPFSFFFRGHVRFRPHSLLFIVTPPLFFSSLRRSCTAEQKQKLKLKRKMTMMERRGEQQDSLLWARTPPQRQAAFIRRTRLLFASASFVPSSYSSCYFSFFISFFHPISILIFSNLPLSARSVSAVRRIVATLFVARSLRTGAMKENERVDTRVNKGKEEGENILKCMKSKWDLGSDRAQPTLTADADARVVVVHLLHEMLLSPSPLISSPLCSEMK